MRLTGRFVSGTGLGTPDYETEIEISPEELFKQLDIQISADEMMKSLGYVKFQQPHP